MCRFSANNKYIKYKSAKLSVVIVQWSVNTSKLLKPPQIKASSVWKDYVLSRPILKMNANHKQTALSEEQEIII